MLYLTDVRHRSLQMYFETESTLKQNYQRGIIPLEVSERISFIFFNLDELIAANVIEQDQ